MPNWYDKNRVYTHTTPEGTDRDGKPITNPGGQKNYGNALEGLGGGIRPFFGTTPDKSSGEDLFFLGDLAVINQLRRDGVTAEEAGAQVGASYAPAVSAGPGSRSYQDIYGEPWWDFFGPLYPDLSSIFSSEGDDSYAKIIERAYNAETAEEAAEILAPLYNASIQEIIDSLKGPGGRFYDPDDDSQGGDDDAIIDPNEEDTDLTGSKTADELQFDEIITASTGFVQDPETINAMIEAWKTGTPLDEGLNGILQKHLIGKGGIGVEFQGKTPDFLLLTIPGLPALASGDISKISLKNPDGSYRTVAEVTGDIRGSLEATVRQIGEIPGKIRDKINELLDAEDIEGALEVMEGIFANEEYIGSDGSIIKTPPWFTVELIGELKDLFGSLSGKWKEGDEDVTSWMGNPFPTDPTEITTEAPTEPPTEAPTEAPTEPPTESPTEPPTEAPTEIITEAPTEIVTEPPTPGPTEIITEAPTEIITEAPTPGPTEIITEKPTEIITESPTEKPTEIITEQPTETITEQPTESPTEAPTSEPIAPPEENGGGGGGAVGGGMFEPHIGGINYGLPGFNPVLHPDKDYNVALDRIMFENLTSPATKRESLFSDFNVA